MQYLTEKSESIAYIRFYLTFQYISLCSCVFSAVWDVSTSVWKHDKYFSLNSKESMKGNHERQHKGFKIFLIHGSDSQSLKLLAGFNVASPAQGVPPGLSRPCGGWEAHSPSGSPSLPTQHTAPGLRDPEEAKFSELIDQITEQREHRWLH